MGAGGRDFHNFLTFFKHKEEYEVVAFTAAQVPGISGRTFPPSLAGKKYPEGIPIFSEEKLVDLIKQEKVELVNFAYSDVSNEYVCFKAQECLGAGADFLLLGPESTMLECSKPVIAVTGTRTGVGKSTVTRYVAKLVKSLGLRVVVVRHPMPYGDLEKQAVQRFEKLEDLDSAECTVEEREEYEPLIREGFIVFAGVDYEKIFEKACEEADVVIWDGGNNDFPFVKPGFWITVADGSRQGHELSYYPSVVNLANSDLVLINKADDLEKVKVIEENVRKVNKDCKITVVRSVLKTSESIKGKKVLVVEDGPSLTHGGVKKAAGLKAAEEQEAIVVDGRDFAVGSIKHAFEEYGIDKAVPALGYYGKQLEDLEETINKADCDLVLSSSPASIEKILSINKPVVRVSYEMEKNDEVDSAVVKFLSQQGLL